MNNRPSAAIGNPQNSHRTRMLALRTTLFIACFALAGCATQPTQLRPTSNVETRAPSRDFMRTGVAGLVKTEFSLALKAGPYRPVGQDADGVFFLGEHPDNFRIFYLERKRFDGKRLIAVYSGGLFVPHRTDSSPRFFILLKSEKLVVVSDEAIATLVHSSGNPAADITSEEMTKHIEKPIDIVLGTGVIPDLMRDLQARGFTFWGPQGDDAQAAKKWLLESQEPARAANS
jgi:hypothetical protein